MNTKKLPLPPIGELKDVLIWAKLRIENDYIEEGDSLPSICVTIGANIKGEWAYQTLDNSYSGPVHAYPHWAVIQLYRRSNCRELARDIREQLSELMEYEWSHANEN